MRFVSTVERPSHATHEVTNQPPPLENFNSFEQDRPLVEALDREGAEWAADRTRDWGKVCGSAQVIRWGFEANEKKPQLRTHDRYGNRIDEVEFDSSWHELMRLGISEGLHASPWREPGPGAHVARAAQMMLLIQAEGGVACPISMTYSAIPALRAQPELAEEWEPRLLSLDYDPRFIPAEQKRGALCGMAMTEKQGGSDVRANTTVAVPLNGGGPGAEYEITGHKWFCSAPMCDAFLVLAQADAGISCFLMPRWTPDGERNRFHLQRLKDKLGNRANASSEVEFRSAWARLIGEEGRGVPTIIEMVNHTRLDCAIGSTAGMRAGVAQATWHAAHRSAFGKLLSEQPLMQNVLADLCVESEAATISALRLARAYDEVAGGDEDAHRFRRLANAVLKYWICKRGPGARRRGARVPGRQRVRRGVRDAAACIAKARCPRSGRGRATCSASTCCERWSGTPRASRPSSPRSPRAQPPSPASTPSRRRFAMTSRRTRRPCRVGLARLVERMALALQGSLLVRYGDPAVADAFCASRLAGEWGQAFGTLPAGTDFARIVERHTPVI